MTVVMRHGYDASHLANPSAELLSKPIRRFRRFVGARKARDVAMVIVLPNGRVNRTSRIPFIAAAQ
jgi:hypothetical protein